MSFEEQEEWTEELEGYESNDSTEMKAGVSGWSISIIVHGVIILAIATLAVAQQMVKEKPPITIIQIPPPPEIVEPPKPIDIKEVKIEVDVPEVVDEPVVTDLDLPEEVSDTEDDIVAEDPKGREEAISDAETGGVAAFMAIGANCGGKGMFGRRKGGGNKVGRGPGGGSRATQDAVTGALKWFKKHQSFDGRWDVDGYVDNCFDNPKCAPGDDASHACTNDGGLGDVACTSYALLCYLGAGYDHKTPSKYKNVVKKGVAWLLEAQKKGVNGEINAGSVYNDHRSYSQAVAVMALAEAYGMTMDSRLKKPTQDGIDQLLEWQVPDVGNPEGGKLGWGYVAKPGSKSPVKSPSRNDLSVTGWACMALKSAKAAGFSVGEGMTGSENVLNKSFAAANPGVDIKALTSGGDVENPSYPALGFPYSYDSKTKECKRPQSLACVGALMAIFLGHENDSPLLGSMVSKIMKDDLPAMKQYPLNTYWMYYDTLTMFQVGGTDWHEWNAVMKDVLVNSQKKSTDGTCFAGSWDSEGTKFHGASVGRLLSTAYCCLSLQVYYRYERLADAKKKNKKSKKM